MTPRRRAERLDVAIVGAGKVGRALFRSLKASGHRVLLRPARKGIPARIRAAIILLVVRDPDVPPLARELAARTWLDPRAVVLHVAGALGPEVLAPLRPRIAGVGVAHPLASFASAAHPPRLTGALLLVAGDVAARQSARRLARALGMRARTWKLDPVLYHAAAVVLSNGAVALTAAASELLVAAGAPPQQTTNALAPLLATTADNVARLGLPGALTGPVRRGDVGTIERHLEQVRRRAPDLVPLYVACARAQLSLAVSIGEASPAALRRLARALEVPWKR